MARMSDYLVPDVDFVSLFSSPEVYPMESDTVSLCDALPTLPIRVSLKLKKQQVLTRLAKFLDSKDDKSEIRILCHYMTTATFLWSVLENYSDRLFIHAHGHDVTWDRKVERLPFVNAHSRGYASLAREVGRKSRVIANSKATIEKLVSIGVPECNIQLKYLGVPDFRTEYNLPHRSKMETPKIVYLGRLVDFKGPIETLKAFELVLEKGFKAELHFIGSGNLENQLGRAIRGSRFRASIHIHGALSNRNAMEHLASAYVLTAHNKRSEVTGQEEAFGVVPIEAMMLGVPVVTGRSGGIIETVVDGKTGLLFEPENIKSHADALVKLLESEEYRDLLGASARQRSLENFSVTSEKSRLTEIMNS